MKKPLLLACLALATLGALAQETATFISSGTWTVPAGVTSIHVEVIGAGGNGAINGSGGGGGGGYAAGDFSVTAGTIYTITVGTGGSTIPTSVLPLGIQATPGVSAVYTSASLGGAGGMGSGGTINYGGGQGGKGTFTYFGGGGGGAAGPDGPGGDGVNTPPWVGVCLFAGGTPGTGGGLPAGAGGKGAGFTDVSCTAADPSQPGENYGGGGGGGNGNSSPPSNGAGGFVRITYCGLVNAPTGDTIQTFCLRDSALISDLSATGDSILWYASDTGTTPLTDTMLLTSGTYYASQTVSGCVSQTRLPVLVQLDSVDIEVTVAGNVLTSAATGATYQWIDCIDNQPIGGATGVSYTATANGTYAVVVTQNGCSDTSACFTITGVGVAALNGEARAGLYPSPAQEAVTLKLSQALQGGYTITDVAGKQVLSGKVSGKTTVIPVRQLANGVYYLQAGGGTYRFVKQ